MFEVHQDWQIVRVCDAQQELVILIALFGGIARDGGAGGRGVLQVGSGQQPVKVDSIMLVFDQAAEAALAFAQLMLDLISSAYFLLQGCIGLAERAHRGTEGGFPGGHFGRGSLGLGSWSSGSWDRVVDEVLCIHGVKPVVRGRSGSPFGFPSQNSKSGVSGRSVKQMVFDCHRSRLSTIGGPKLTENTAHVESEPSPD